MSLESLEVCKIASTVPLREVRLAVSMVGGTSLAIYENGVAQELLRLVQGRGAYGLLKRLTRSHALIDILSGTSAGGINSIFLATSLANGTDLWSSRSVWINAAGIDDLLPDPRDRSVHSILRGNAYYLPELRNAFKGLVSGGPHEERATAFPLRSGYDVEEVPGEYRKIDLFVTGTYIEGMPSVFFDTRNQPIFNENHNGVFHLKHRPERKESHFCPHLELLRGHETAARAVAPGADRQDRDDLYDRLATVARTTSSLPAIFEPSKVSHRLMQGIIPLPKGREVASGAADRVTYFGDGGYLNNRPLNLVLRKIRSRSSGPEVLRKVVFVEPVAEGMRQQVALQKEPTALEHLLFYAAVQGKQSLRDQLESIQEHNHSVRRVRTALSSARLEAVSSIPGAEDTTRRLWARLRLLDLRDAMIDRWEASVSRESEPDFTMTQAQVVRRLGEAWNHAEHLRMLRAHMLQHLEAQCLDLDPKAKNGFQLDQVDVQYLERKLLRLKDDIRDTLYPCEDSELNRVGEQTRRQLVLQVLARSGQTSLPERAGELANKLEKLSKLHMIVELVRALARDVVDAVAVSEGFRKLVMPANPAGFNADTAAEALWALLSGAVMNLLSPLDGVSIDDPHRFQETVRMRSIEICAAIKDRTPLPEPGVNGPRVLEAIEAAAGQVATDLAADLAPVVAVRRVELDSTVANYRERRAEWIPFDWAYAENIVTPNTWDQMRAFLDRLDHHLYPVERAANLPSVSTIELVHVSARDVQVGLSREVAENKLAGDVLMNLGGFFKRSWRVNDVLWGRLDGSGALVELLLDPARLRRVVMEAAGQPHQGRELLAAIEGYLSDGSPSHQDGDVPVPDSIGVYLRAYPLPNGEPTLSQILHKAQIWFANPRAENVSGKWVATQLANWLLRRHQLEILLEEVPDAIAEDLFEHGEWQGAGMAGKHARSDSRKAADALATLAGGTPGRSTRTSLEELAREWSQRQFAVSNADPNEKSLARRLDAKGVHDYFKSRYKTGEETVTGDIPPLVSARRAAAGLAVTLDVLHNSLSQDPRKSVSQNPLWRSLVAPVSLAARVLYGVISVTAYGRGPAIALHAAALTLVLIGGVLLALHGLKGTPAQFGPWAVGLVVLIETVYWSLRLRTPRGKS